MKTLKEFNDAGFKLVQANLAKWVRLYYTFKDVEKLTVEDIRRDDYYLEDYSFYHNGDEEILSFTVIPPESLDYLDPIEVDLDEFLNQVEESEDIDELIKLIYS